MTGSFRTTVAFLAALLLFAATESRAQSIGIGGSGGPLEITADQGIEWNRDKRQYIARGNARAAQGDSEVRADVLIAFYEAGSGEGAQATSQIYRIEARGNVRITTAREKVTGDKAIYDLRRRSMTITGDSVALRTKSELITAKESLQYLEGEKLAIARGEATVVREDKRLAADQIRAYLMEAPEGGANAGELVLERVEAEGDVRVSTPKDFVRGDRGIYYAQEELATLEGRVRITSDGNQLNGGYAEVNLATGVSKLVGAPGQDGRVRGLLIPESAPKPPQ